MKRTPRIAISSLMCMFWLGSSDPLMALDGEKLRVKRAEVFEFVQKPKVYREGDRITVSFETKDWCDATVAIEDDQGRIIRHLASGVLGKDAPGPFKKGTRRQAVVWDGKDELGAYVDNKDELTVRVSLGLKPRYERTLFWSPRKRSSMNPFLRVTKEGVYVYENTASGKLILFDHTGDYVRTVYPFPGSMIKKVQGLKWLTLPPEGKRFPAKWGLAQTTFLTLNGFTAEAGWPSAGGGPSATAMDVRDGRIALVGQTLNRLSTDGSTGGRTLSGPKVTFPVSIGRVHSFKGGIYDIAPRSIAVCPNGKWLYCAGYRWGNAWREGMLSGVGRLALDGSSRAKVFLGSMKKGAKGKGNKDFNAASSVDCDADGRLYVSDYLNDRIQVFKADGTFVRSIKVQRPALVRVDRKSGRIYAFSWSLQTGYSRALAFKGPSRLTCFGPLKNPKPLAVYTLDTKGGGTLQADVNPWTNPPTIWLGPTAEKKGPWWRKGFRVLRPEGKKLMTVRDFGKESLKKLKRPRPPRHTRQRLYVNPATGKLYVGEHTQPTVVACKSFFELLEINPESGKIKKIGLPLDCEDMGFDYKGLAYLRTYEAITRFDPRTWREVPFDYGEERPVGHGPGGGGNKGYHAVSAISLPGVIGGMFHLGGFGVSPQGNMVVSCINPNTVKDRKAQKNCAVKGKAYTPKIYPGRRRGFETHVFDRYGNLIQDDVLPGIGHSNMVLLDKDGFVYVMAQGATVLDGKPYINDTACTLIKAKPGRTKVLSTKGVIPLNAGTCPKRKPDMDRCGGSWVTGAEWIYGPAGMDGKNLSSAHRNCSCTANSRPTIDYYARLFVPEVDRYRIAILDANGNVITRVGRYGNVDDGMPLIAKGGPKTPRSIGGDEVALMVVMNVAVHTDRRLYLADVGNERIISVKLGYHTVEKVSLASVRDHAEVASR